MVLVVRLVAVIMVATYAAEIGVRQRLLGENLARENLAAPASLSAPARAGRLEDHLFQIIARQHHDHEIELAALAHQAAADRLA